MKRIFSWALCLVLLVCLLTASFDVQAAYANIVTPATGYTKASDVQYVTASGTVVNWGARDEDCLFLSTYAQNFYTGNYTYNVLSKNSGGSSQSNAPNSALYSALKSMMTAKHNKQTSYGETRYLYRYTDCLKNDYSKISSFYSGQTLNGTWDSGSTWNREHTWPDSKGLGGNDENDIMMLRPTSVSENSSRGNTAYGEGVSYYDPGVSVRGDCARIVLYVYVRWGNTSKMWGSSGVMQNLDILLKWMEEDPVDTWEMGRNDSVQSITGTRNVFVDYPEYAWLLFGREIPNTVNTPSGIAKGGSGSSGGTVPPTTTTTGPCPHTYAKNINEVAATCGKEGYTGDFYCANCATTLQKGSTIPATGNHKFGDWVTVIAPSSNTTGKCERTCSDCKKVESNTIPSLGGSQQGTTLPIVTPTTTMPPLPPAGGDTSDVTTTTGVLTTTTTASRNTNVVQPTIPPAGSKPQQKDEFPIVAVAVAGGVVLGGGAAAVTVILVLKKKKKSV